MIRVEDAVERIFCGKDGHRCASYHNPMEKATKFLLLRASGHPLALCGECHENSLKNKNALVAGATEVTKEEYETALVLSS